MIAEMLNEVKKFDKMNDFERNELSENLLKEAGKNKEIFIKEIQNIRFKNDPEYYDYNLWDIYSIIIKDFDNWYNLILDEVKRLLDSYNDEQSLKDINYFLMVYHKIPSSSPMIIKFAEDLYEISLNMNNFVKILIYDLIIGLLKNTENKVVCRSLEFLIKLHESKDSNIRIFANKILKKYNISGYNKELSIIDKLKSNSFKLL